MSMYQTLITLGTATYEKQNVEDFRLKPIRRDFVLRFVDEYQLRELVPEVNSFFFADGLCSGVNKKNVTDQLGHTGLEKQEIVNEPKRTCVVCVNDVFSLIPCAGKRLAVFLKENTKGDSFLVAVGGIEYLYQGPMRELVEYAKAATCIITPDLKSLYHTSSTWFSIASEKFLDLGLLAYLLRPEENDFSWDKLACGGDGLGISGENHGLLALGLAEKFERELEDNGLRQLMMHIELPLVKVLVNMEKVGVGINRASIKYFIEELQVGIGRCESVIFDIAGKEFNILSSKQLGKVLYEDLGLVFKDKALGRPTSTPKDVLVQLDDPSGIVDHVLELRKLGSCIHLTLPPC